ncbi:hypothetical protein K7X08_033745 [Anisodus acutangulus]|uniref:Uncharacterized protein n=1 Tax=Anisodus acutangulus TaxID=402998 RepID=A0A9Q1RCW7_9SOLA|nr:hypothetical protein K7X08_033745 [Anisodus acutangulus]
MFALILFFRVPVLLQDNLYQQPSKGTLRRKSVYLTLVIFWGYCSRLGSLCWLLCLFNTLKAQEESRALHEMVTAIDEDPEERIEKMSMILMKIKDFMMTENPKIDSSLRESYHCFSWAENTFLPVSPLPYLAFRWETKCITMCVVE